MVIVLKAHKQCLLTLHTQCLNINMKNQSVCVSLSGCWFWLLTEMPSVSCVLVATHNMGLLIIKCRYIFYTFIVEEDSFGLFKSMSIMLNQM